MNGTLSENILFVIIGRELLFSNLELLIEK